MFLISVQQLLSAPIYREEPGTHCRPAGVTLAQEKQPEKMSDGNTEDGCRNLEVGARGL